MDSRIFLTLSASSLQGSVGLFRLKNRSLETLALRKWSSAKPGGPPLHSEKLPFVMQEVLDEASLRLEDLDFLSVDIGPGRWTGIRAGVNAVKTAAFVGRKPVRPLNSLSSTAEGFSRRNAPFAVAFNSFKNSVYCAVFHKGKELKPPRVLSIEEWRKEAPPFCAGDVGLFYPVPESVEFQAAFPSAENMARLILRESAGPLKTSAPQEIHPLYLRSF